MRNIGKHIYGVKTMQRLIDLINEKALRYEGELFFADGEFFAIYDGKIAKLPDFSGDIRGMYKLLPSTERFIDGYMLSSGLEFGSLIDVIGIYKSELELYNDEIPDGLDYDSFNFLYACQNEGISPYCAYNALLLMMEGVEAGGWVLLDGNREYTDVITYISEGCELIDFAYTDEDDDEYWEEIISNIERYFFDGGEVY